MQNVKLLIYICLRLNVIGVFITVPTLLQTCIHKTLEVANVSIISRTLGINVTTLLHFSLLLNYLKDKERKSKTSVTAVLPGGTVPHLPRERQNGRGWNKVHVCGVKKNKLAGGRMRGRL